MALRLLYDVIPVTGALSERLTLLGYNAADRAGIQDLIGRGGMFILSGPVNSGKSTLLKNIIETAVKESPEKSYHSIEDPPEYIIDGVCQVKVLTGKREASGESDAEARRAGYTDKIAGVQRSDPNTMMIGEIRYPEAVEAALHAALSGISVLATLHASSALGIIRRMEAMLTAVHFAEPLEFLCDEKIICGLSHQRLAPILCPQCKQSLLEAQKNVAHFTRVMPDSVLQRLKRVAPLELVKVRGEGCSECDGLGFTGQTVVAEVIVTNYQLLGHIRNGHMSDAYSYWINEMSGKTFVEDAIDKIKQGILDPFMTEQRLGASLSTAMGGEQYSRNEG
jgi:type II secretory ATPase GspE/PulE/Tfp pilus assembly ATPase PilB-like protein